MPFTFAHPAAVLPLHRLCPRYLLWSGLIIGSLCPDAAYFVRALPIHAGTDRWWLALVQDIFVGVVLFAVWHTIVKRPAALLLPSKHRLALWSATARPLGPLGGISLRLLPSLLIGAATHRAWDSLTHHKSMVADHLPALRLVVLSVGSYEMHVTQVLQHGSTIVGLGILLWYYLSWLRTAASKNDEPGPAIPFAWRLLILFAIGGSATAIAAWQTASTPGYIQPSGLVRFVIIFLTAAGSGLVLWSLTYLVWRLRATARRRGSWGTFS